MCEMAVVAAPPHYHHNYELYTVVSVNLKFEDGEFKRYTFHYHVLALTCYKLLVLFLSGIPFFFFATQTDVQKCLSAPFFALL